MTYIYQKKKAEKLGISYAALRRYGFEIISALKEKYGNKCDICKSEHDLTIHHIDGKGRNYLIRGLKMNNSLDNLQVLCRRCHGRIDSKKRTKQVKLFGPKNPFYGKKHSVETKQKMRLAKLGRAAWNKGKKASLETRLKISLANKNRPINPKAIEAMRQANLGKQRTEETKKKIKEAKLKYYQELRNHIIKS